MEVFIEGPHGPSNYATFFEASDGRSEAPLGAYLYVSDVTQERIVWHACVSEDIDRGLRESDVEILWSADKERCAAAINGCIRAVINLKTGVEFEASSGKAANTTDWEREFEQYLDLRAFLDARQLHWKRMVDPQAINLPESGPATSKFIQYRRCDSLAAVFEDDTETGYLYLYDIDDHRIRDYVQVYDNSAELGIRATDVEVTWSGGCHKCGVAILGAFRAIIDVVANRTGRAKLSSRSSPGITDKSWLSGLKLA